jgi:hypothetical protein
MRTRAWRRHHERRMKRRVTSYYGGYARHDPRETGRIARTRALCSGPCCGNPRRWFGARTLQEIRAAEVLLQYDQD